MSRRERARLKEVTQSRSSWWPYTPITEAAAAVALDSILALTPRSCPHKLLCSYNSKEQGTKASPFQEDSSSSRTPWCLCLTFLKFQDRPDTPTIQFSLLVSFTRDQTCIAVWRLFQSFRASSEFRFTQTFSPKEKIYIFECLILPWHLLEDLD